VNVSSDPGSQTVVKGVSGFTFANYLFDASASGEDLRVNSAQLNIVTTTGASYPTNCYAWDGTTRLNDSVVNPAAPDGAQTFTFNNPLTIPKGTIKTVTLKCDLPSSLTTGDTIYWGVDSSHTISGVGLGSGSTVDMTTATVTGGVMTLGGGGTLVVETAAESPSYALAAAGTSDVTLGVLNFRATNEPIKLNKLGLILTNGTSASVQTVSLWDGATQVGTATFTSGNSVATSTLSGNFVVTPGTDKKLTMKGNLSDIGISSSGVPGALIQVNYRGTYNAEGTGQSSGTTINSTSAVTAVAGVRMLKSYPTFEKIALSDSTLANGERPLLRFKVTANSKGSIGIYKFTVRLATTTVSVNELNIYGFTDSGFSTPVTGVSSDGGMASTTITLDGHDLIWATWVTSTSDLNFYAQTSAGASTTIQVPAGQSRYFEVRGTISGASSGDSIVTELHGDSAYPANITSGENGLMASSSFVGSDTNNDFIWAANSTTTVDTAAEIDGTSRLSDFTNGYGVPGLPATTINQSLSL
jgi:hypothetical protein